MCGICGYIKIGQEAGDQDPLIVGKMVKSLVHRGPDQQDVAVFDNVAFGFSRLAIIGLQNGMQPIYNEDRSLVLVCNGEVFNYIELREELIKKGHHFKTESDVEVIVHLYEEYGLEQLNKINGQFAFALYDSHKKMLFCARDQMGINPLYYTFVDNTFVFGSEIKAILEYPGVKKEVDKVSLDQIFTFPGIVSPRTIFEDIHSLENGHYITVNAHGELRKHEYWDLTYPQGRVEMNGISEEGYKDRLEELLDQSIKLRLRSEVPYGTYLSGGLDSSIITKKVSQFTNHRNQAFSIDFPDAQISEAPFQMLVADQSNTQLNKKTFLFSDISERLQQCIYHCETPIKETFNSATHYLSESVRDKGIRVILSGQGSDELFAGYVGYRFDKMREAQLVNYSLDPNEEYLRNKVWGDKNFVYERNFLDFIDTKKSLFSKDLFASFDDMNSLNHPVIDTNKLKGLHMMNKRSYIDFKIRMIDHLLSDFGDRMALANSIEVRYPFLDKDLVEFSTTIPADLKLNELNEKYILKETARRFLPETIIDREKFGFVAPGSPYLLQNNVEYIHDLLSYDLIKRQNFFDADKIEELKKVYSQEGYAVNVPFETDYLIIVITFGILLDTFF